MFDQSKGNHEEYFINPTRAHPGRKCLSGNIPYTGSNYIRINHPFAFGHRNCAANTYVATKPTTLGDLDGDGNLDVLVGSLMNKPQIWFNLTNDYSLSMETLVTKSRNVVEKEQMSHKCRVHDVVFQRPIPIIGFEFRKE